MTTRKLAARAARRLAFPGSLLGLALGLSGCSTPGPTHAYLASRADAPIIDVIADAPDREVPTYLNDINELYGIAYDPFTDHFFLRVFPGDFVRVIDRPARKIKRSFIVADLPPGRGDLAIRSFDRHLFFADPTRPALLETTLRGRTVRTIALAGLDTPAAGVAYDQKRDQLYILRAGADDAPALIDTYSLAGERLSTVTLDQSVRRGSLAFGSDASEFYVPLLGKPAVGIFNAEGRLLRTLVADDGVERTFIDVGPRSLVRMF